MWHVDTDKEIKIAFNETFFCLEGFEKKIPFVGAIVYIDKDVPFIEKNVYGVSINNKKNCTMIFFKQQNCFLK